MLVFLIGFMGSGKTTLGKALASQLDWSFIDLDREIENFSDCSIPKLFERLQENGFRLTEQLVLLHIVKHFQHPAQAKQNCIIACGGGTPCHPQSLALMKENGFVIYLEVTPEILCERLLLTPAGQRPLLPTQDPAKLLASIRKLLARRRPFYEAAHWRC